MFSSRPMVLIDQVWSTAYKQQGEKSITWVGLTSETVAVGFRSQPGNRTPDVETLHGRLQRWLPHADATHLHSIGHVGGARHDSVIPLPSPNYDIFI